jgi:molybdate transport repressor ModE-like protein/molybdopterin-binding protein
MRRAVRITDTDVALLRSLGGARSIVAASRTVGITRDRATYRIARLERALGGPVVASVRGGRSHGESHLTALGDLLLRRGFDSVELLDARPLAPPSPSNRLDGTYHRSPAPQVAFGPGLAWRVAFDAEEGERVSMLLDPEAVLLARRRFPSSARNVHRATVESVRPGLGPLSRTVVLRAGPLRLRVAVTEEPVRELHLSRGAPVWLYVKATALRRIGRGGPRPTLGSLRRSAKRPPPPRGGSASR